MLFKNVIYFVVLSALLKNVVAAPVEPLKRDDSALSDVLSEILSIALDFISPSATSIPAASGASDPGFVVTTTTVFVTVSDDSTDSVSAAFADPTNPVSVDPLGSTLTSPAFSTSVAIAAGSAPDTADAAGATDGFGVSTDALSIDSLGSTSVFSADPPLATADPSAFYPTITGFDATTTTSTDPSVATVGPNADPSSASITADLFGSEPASALERRV